MLHPIPFHIFLTLPFNLAEKFWFLFRYRKCVTTSVTISRFIPFFHYIPLPISVPTFSSSFLRICFIIRSKSFSLNAILSSLLFLESLAALESLLTTAFFFRLGSESRNSLMLSMSSLWTMAFGLLLYLAFVTLMMKLTYTTGERFTSLIIIIANCLSSDSFRVPMRTTYRATELTNVLVNSSGDLSCVLAHEFVEDNNCTFLHICHSHSPVLSK